jgi:glycerophosphoryl diester phosphodiesterase
VRVWNVAHRGASSEAPENTLAAFALALTQGADVVETDVHLSADGVPVCLHDDTLDRTTNGRGPVGALTLAGLRALDAGGGERVPAVAEVLQAARGRARVNLDLKEAAAAEPALAVVREAGMVDDVTFISFLPEALDVIDRLSPESLTIRLVDSASALAGLATGAIGSQETGSGLGVPNGIVTPELVETLQRHGAGVFAWTVDDEAEMRRLVEAGVNGIVTNRPAALAEVLRRLGAARRV